MVHCRHRRSVYNYCSCLGPPRTFEEACQAFEEKDLPFPRFRRTNQEQRAAVNEELSYHRQFPEPWHGSNAEWENLNDILLKEMEEIHYPSPPSRSSRESAFEDDWEHIAPAGGASHPAAASGRADRAGGHPSYMPSHHALHSESSDREATPPPPYSGYLYPGARNARRHGEAHEAPRHPGGRSNGGFREEHSNSRHYGDHNNGGFREDDGNSRYHGGRNNGGFREEHGNSRRQGSLNAAHSHGGSLEPDTSSESDAEASHSASESHHIDPYNEDLRYMDRVGIPEGRRTDWVRTRDTVLQNQMRQQQPNPLLSGRRRRGGWRD